MIMNGAERGKHGYEKGKSYCSIYLIRISFFDLFAPRDPTANKSHKMFVEKIFT